MKVGLMMQIEESDKQLISDAAHKDKKSMSEWMRIVLVANAKHTLGVK